MPVKQKTMPAAEFKAKCLRILDELEPAGILITKRGRPVARLLPAVEEDNQKLIGSMKGKIRIKVTFFLPEPTGMLNLDTHVVDFRSDPADEIIAATSIVEEMPLLTRDTRLLKSKMVPLA